MLSPLRELMCEAVSRPSENVAQTIKACMHHRYVLPIGVGVMTKAKGWHCKDAPGGTFIVLDHRAPKQGAAGTTLERSHSYIIAVADREGFVVVRAIAAADMVPLAYWACSDLCLGNDDLDAVLVDAERELVAGGIDVERHNPPAKVGTTATDMKSCRRGLSGG